MNIEHAKKKVLVIGLDGCRPDALLAADTPNIDRIASNGIYSWNARTEFRTISGSAWTSLLTGVHMEKHNVFGNNFRPRDIKYKTLYYYLKEWWSELRIVAYSHWRPIITKIFEKGIMSKKGSGSDKKVTKKLIKSIKNDNGDLYFIQLDEIDGAGHKYSYGPDSKRYIECIEGRDAMVGDIINAVKQRKKEDWLIIVVSDHGGTGHGHGKPTLDELKIVFIISNDALVEKGEISTDENNDEYVEIVDIVPTIAYFMGYNIRDEWDGVVRGFIQELP
ncbi:MAG: sulfatase-like hydrolase/transferase [Candidatus Lokiarchaeota archaeon]|nr:sulfatase-like hydrolase/transferase [Candidatus Lokiarchaeota archaeon]